MALALPQHIACRASADWREFAPDSTAYVSTSAGFPDIPPGPCEGCEHRARCAAELLACMSFAEFVRRGTEAVPSMPRRDVFVGLFGMD